jgi:hypothetical protein
LLAAVAGAVGFGERRSLAVSTRHGSSEQSRVEFNTQLEIERITEN